MVIYGEDTKKNQKTEDANRIFVKELQAVAVCLFAILLEISPVNICPDASKNGGKYIYLLLRAVYNPCRNEEITPEKQALCVE
jgi:hypothetical protein